jgi:hypothetical protein
VGLRESVEIVFAKRENEQLVKKLEDNLGSKKVG